MSGNEVLSRALAASVFALTLAGNPAKAQQGTTDKIEVIEKREPTEAEKAEVKTLKPAKNCTNVKEMRCIDNQHRWQAAAKNADRRADDDRQKRGIKK